MGWTALHMSGDCSQSGFKTSDEAWDYMVSFRCDGCVKEVKEKGEDDAHIGCDAEWEIITDEEWESYQ